jgi:cytochrome c-type biogenesis protein CcmH
MRRDDDKVNTGILKRLVIVLALCLLPVAVTVQAGVTLEAFKFDSKAEEQHFKSLIEELRCLVCQNQSLADSDAELAHDLRAEVYEMIQAGNSDEEIVTFLVARYGDFVLYNPPVKPSTYLIWFGPFVLLLLAAFILLRSIRRQQKVPAGEISAANRERLNALMGSTTSEQDKKQ